MRASRIIDTNPVGRPNGAVESIVAAPFDPGVAARALEKLARLGPAALVRIDDAVRMLTAEAWTLRDRAESAVEAGARYRAERLAARAKRAEEAVSALEWVRGQIVAGAREVPE